MPQQRSQRNPLVTLMRSLLPALCAAALIGWAFAWAAARPALAQDTPDAATPITGTAPATGTTGITSTAAFTAAGALTPGVGLPAGGIAAPDQACRLCHGSSTASKQLPSGEVLNAGIDLSALDNSVHGSHAAASVYCTDCHQPRARYQFPHAANPAQTLHDFSAEIANNCQSCHLSIELHNPGHLQAQRAGTNPNLPTCTDCHGGHTAAPVAQLTSDPIAFCQSCHTIADMQDEQVKWVHEQTVWQLGGARTCQTCHTDAPQTQSQQCANCHGLLQAQVMRPASDGEGGMELVHLNVQAHDLLSSVHGERVIDGVAYPALECAECHEDMAEAGFPHPQELLVNRQQLRKNVEASCVDCHEEIGNQFADGIHAERAEEGKLNAASCADCHGSHNIQPPNVPRTRISDTCGNCHAEIFEQYKTSVHGAALYGRDNPDVPVCTDCHGAHQIDDPTTAAFRLSSPEMCGKCHADKELMTKYEISTSVFDTYVSDFHGTTVTLFQHSSPNEPTNKAVCYDCHGVHDIQSVSDASEEQIRARLLVTCQKCHPDAGDNFPSAWMSHYEPSLEHYPLVYLVNLFYKVMIPTVLGGFALFIGSDIFRRTTDRIAARRERRRARDRQQS